MRKTGALLMLLAASASAQRTSTLGQVEPEISYEVAVGGNSSLIGSGYGAQTGALRALSVSQRRAITGPMDLWIDAWVIQRRPSGEFGYANSRFRSGRLQRLESSWVLSGVVAGGLPIHFPLDLVLDPRIGLGVAPVAYGHWVDLPGASGSSSPGASSTFSQAIVLTAGVSLRWHHIIVEQHFVQVTGADAAVGNGENAPLMVGWRF